MDNFIKYQDWPRYVKIVTAFSWEKFYLNHSTVSNTTGWICVILGAIGITYMLFASTAYGIADYFTNLFLIAIGVFNLICGSAIHWVNQYSSWDERFSNTSIVQDKIISAIFVVSLFAGMIWSISL